MVRSLFIFVSLISFALTATGADYLKEQLSALPKAIDCETISNELTLGAIDGCWQLTHDGGEIAVIPVKPSNPENGYIIIALDAADRSIIPGTVMGYARHTARRNTFDAIIYSDSADGALRRPKKFTLTLSDDNHLSIVPVKNRLKLNIRNLLPYMFRVSVSRHSNRPENLDGAVRVSGRPGERPLNIRVL